MCNKLTMEAAEETFENLPESLQIRFLMQRFNILQQKRIYEDNSPEKNFESSDSRKKQRTLDSWLIKRDSSINKIKVGESPSQIKIPENSNSTSVSDVSKNCSQSNKANSTMGDADSANSLHWISNGSKFSEDAKHKSNKLEKNEDNSLKDVLIDSSDNETTGLVNEKYNLRSKKNFSKQSSVNEYNDNTMKYNKKGSNFINTSERDKNLTHKKTFRGENENHKSNKDLTQSHPTETSVSQNCLLSNIAQTILNEKDFTNARDMEKKEYYTFDNLSGHTSNKTTCIFSSKKRKRFVKSCTACSSGNVACGSLNDNLRALSQNNEEVSRMSVSQQSNYEAFSKLNSECSQAGLNILDILEDEKIQNLLSDHKNLNNEAIVFIGPFKSSTGKILPVVHLLESKKKLLESIYELQKIPL